MTDQEAFDKAVSGVIAQGVPSIRPGDSSLCLYRGPNGTKCAFGHLIPDEAYDKNMEGRGSYGLIADFPQISALAIDQALAGELQSAHDFAASTWKTNNNDAEFVADFKSRARAIAAERGLNTTVLENAA